MRKQIAAPFSDEIGDVSLDTQAKLLRVLETNTIPKSRY
ncbi:MAG: sigma 54-interacting transcriptional regulator [Ignavibacteria bacterium]|nr:sigma 54-interacting transcriptional regulator [Ignavibacteria bacterium]